MMRTFRVAEGRVVVLPRDVLPGPGDVNLRYQGGDTLAIPEECVKRFVRRRLETGDLVDVEHQARSGGSPIGVG
jgi:hypothetical protein